MKEQYGWPIQVIEHVPQQALGTRGGSALARLPGTDGGSVHSDKLAWTSPVVSDGTLALWIPQVSQFLPHSWMDMAQDVSIAVKNDKATVPMSLWNNRCSLIFPHHSLKSLEVLRHIIKRRQVRNLILELLSFLKSNFGHSWVNSLYEARSKARG